MPEFGSVRRDDFAIDGFGGSVSALRLSEKGYSVVVLEMGKRWKREDFPKSTWDVRKHHVIDGLIIPANPPAEAPIMDPWTLPDPR